MCASSLVDGLTPIPWRVRWISFVGFRHPERKAAEGRESPVEMLEAEGRASELTINMAGELTKDRAGELTKDRAGESLFTPSFC